RFDTFRIYRHQHEFFRQAILSRTAGPVARKERPLASISGHKSFLNSPATSYLGLGAFSFCYYLLGIYFQGHAPTPGVDAFVWSSANSVWYSCVAASNHASVADLDFGLEPQRGAMFIVMRPLLYSFVFSGAARGTHRNARQCQLAAPLKTKREDRV